MSASSWLVTAGIMIALRSKLAPLIFLIRPISLRSIGPNLAKSTFGQGIKPNSEPPPPAGALAACALVWVAPAMTALVKVCTSPWVIRPLGPWPLTSSKGTPSSRANLRTEGDACGKPKVGAPGACAGAAKTATATVAIAAGAATAGAEATAVAATGATATATEPSKIANKSPMLTVSPTLTINSMTVTSSKSPMSGTCTSTNVIGVSRIYAYSGLILSTLMPYFLMASATFVAGNIPSSLSALSAATTM